MTHEQLTELDRMCGNLADLASQEVNTQAKQFSDTDERRTVWHNDRDVRVARDLVSNAAVMYNILEMLRESNYVIDREAMINIIDHALREAKPEMDALPEIEPGTCDSCEKDLTPDEMIALRCGCGVSLKVEDV